MSTDPEVSRPPVLGYAAGGFARKPSAPQTLVVANVLVGLLLVLLNFGEAKYAWESIRTPPIVPAQPYSDEIITNVPPWQYWSAFIEADVSIALALMLIAGVYFYQVVRARRLTLTLCIVYSICKLVITLAGGLLWSWNSDKQRVDWGIAGVMFVVGMVHPLWILGMVRRANQQIRAFEAAGGE